MGQPLPMGIATEITFVILAGSAVIAQALQIADRFMDTYEYHVEVEQLQTCYLTVSVSFSLCIFPEAAGAGVDDCL